MNKIKYMLILLITILSCAKEPTQFSAEALNDTFTTLGEKTITFKEILEAQEGKMVLIDIWASWCSDCLKGMPKVKALQREYTEVSYVFLSLDRSKGPWKRGIKKYDVVGDHYYMQDGKDSPFADFVNISWIPRYMLINKAGEIVVFDVIEADDHKLIEALKK